MIDKLLVDMGRGSSPEENLQLAVAANAIHDYIYAKPPRAGRMNYRHLLLEYYRLMRNTVSYLFTDEGVWLESENGEHKANVFAFPYVCKWFDLPLAEIREAIVKQRKELNRKGE